MQIKNGWTNGQYAIYRVTFGLYLLQHFLGLLPWGGELFSSAGILPDGSFSPLIHLFPNILALWDSPIFVESCLCVGAVLSSFFIFGKFDRIAAVLIWYLLACFYGRNPLIGNPSLPFIGWLLLAHSLMRPQFRSSAFEKNDVMRVAKPPTDIYVAAWVLMSLAYTYSGYTKLISPSWLDGSALSRVLANPLARDTFLRPFLLSLPRWILKAATWSGSLGIELRPAGAVPQIAAPIVAGHGLHASWPVGSSELLRSHGRNAYLALLHVQSRGFHLPALKVKPFSLTVRAAYVMGLCGSC